MFVNIPSGSNNTHGIGNTMTRRQIVVKGNTFEYFVGINYLCIWAPDGSKYAPPLSEVKGISSENFSRGKYKGTEDGMITPKDVAGYIEPRTSGKDIHA